MQEQVKMSFFNVEYHIQVIDQGLYTENHYPQCFPMSSTLPGSHQIARRFSLAVIKIAGWEDQGRFNLLSPQIMSRPVISYYCSVASRSIRSLEPLNLSIYIWTLLYQSMESLSGNMEKTQSNPIEWCYFYEKIILSHVVNCVYLYHQQPCILEERALWARRLSLGCRGILILTRTSPLGPWQSWHSTPCLTINETSLIWSKYSN